MEQFYNSMPACLDKGDALLFSNNQNAPIVRIADRVEPIFQLFPRPLWCPNQDHPRLLKSIYQVANLTHSVLSDDLRLRWIVKSVH
jgi:hypothetical protein